jgi:hypothetical protein
VGHRLETRKDGNEVKVIDLTLRVQPFTAQLASALDPDYYGFVKRHLFALGDGSPITDLKAAEFRSTSDRQLLTVFASPDTSKASIAFDQVKIGKVRARTEKGIDGWTLVIKASFGPVGRAELESVNAWYTEQRFVTFEEAEPSLEFAEEGKGDDDDDDDEDQPAAREAPMFDDAGRAADASAPAPAPETSGPRHRKTH